MTSVLPSRKVSSLDQRTRDEAMTTLRSDGKKGSFLPFIGPAVVASVAYIDPGNFATNLQAGSTLGYKLLWVVLWANVMAMFIQTLSAKLGIATGKNLPEHIRDHWPKPLVWFYWVQAEVIAMFTDLAEFLGATVGFHLIAGLPMSVSVVLAFIATMIILYFERHGFRGIEAIVGALVAVIALAYAAELLLSPVDWPQAALGTLIPNPGGDQGIYLAVGILGATVMPHVIYLHSSLTQARIVVEDALKPRLMRFTRWEVVLAMGLAGLVNMAMLAAAAATFYGHEQVAHLQQAWKELTPALGPAAAALFAVALLASGVSSSVVGTLSGQVVMQGFVGFSIPLWLRRIATSLPAVIVIALGINTTNAMVFSQVVLSFGIPLALVPLIIFTSRRDLMGVLVNTPRVQAIGWFLTAIIIVLNAWLIVTSV